MLILFSFKEVFTGHNGGASSASSSSSRKLRRSNALDIIHPETGIDISDEIYNNDSAKGDIDNREAPQMQVSTLEISL